MLDRALDCSECERSQHKMGNCSRTVHINRVRPLLDKDHSVLPNWTPPSFTYEQVSVYPPTTVEVPEQELATEFSKPSAGPTCIHYKKWQSSEASLVLQN